MITNFQRGILTFMAFLLGLAWSSLGLIVGSFLNVVLLRYHTGRTVRGRSSCLSCGKRLEPHELIPVVSYLLQCGRCRSCGSRISPQYPVVEMGTGLLFLGVYLLGLPAVSALTTLVAGALLILIGVYDVRHKIIPDVFVYLLSALGALSLFIRPDLSVAVPDTVAVLAGPLFALPFLVLSLVSSGRWMGLGDAKLALALGWLLGAGESVTAFLLSFWIGTVAVGSVAFARALVRTLGAQELFSDGKALTMETEVPFAPFLILGAVIAYALALDGMELLSLFSAHSLL